MNAVEIAEASFDPAEFPYAFLEAFGNKETTLRRLRSGDSNQSDLPGGVLQRNNIHLRVCAEGEVGAALAALCQSPATTRQKAKVLNPLFLDELRARLDEAGDGKFPGSARKLLNLRQRLARIRVFDPACGSGNFLVIAYKELRALEADINERRGETGRPSDLPLTNFRGIELRHFSCEIARLALIIAEYQCDVLYRGQKLALLEFLPLEATNWITCGNALRLDWLSVCPPTGTAVRLQADDLFGTPLDQAEIEFKNEGGETYICGSPPYIRDKYQNAEQKEDLKSIRIGKQEIKAIDYIAGWFWKASDFIRGDERFAFVSTNSICQGVQVPLVWPRVISKGREIFFAHEDFLWGNNAARKAQVTCVIIGVRNKGTAPKEIYADSAKKTVDNINVYLTAGPNLIVEKASTPISQVATMFGGNIPRDRGNLLLSPEDKEALLRDFPDAKRLLKPILGSNEFINGLQRYCLWIEDRDAEFACSIPPIAARLNRIREYRLSGSERGKSGLETPYKFERTIIGKSHTIIVPSVSSERRPFLPCGLLNHHIRVSNLALAIYDAPLWSMALIASRLHLVWIATVCGKLETRYRYSNTLGWNTFPVLPLTDKARADLTRCAEDILLAREAHFPATIADLYDPETMPADLRAAHERNDETLERIYLGRRFKNDTERLEKLFALYTLMAARQPVAPKKSGARKPRVSDS